MMLPNSSAASDQIGDHVSSCQTHSLLGGLHPDQRWSHFLANRALSPTQGWEKVSVERARAYLGPSGSSSVSSPSPNKPAPCPTPGPHQRTLPSHQPQEAGSSSSIRPHSVSPPGLDSCPCPEHWPSCNTHTHINTTPPSIFTRMNPTGPSGLGPALAPWNVP